MKIEIPCKNCNILFYKQESEIKKVINNFCSRKCAATYNNKLYPKRPHTNMCRLCGDRTKKGSAKYCEKCYPDFCLKSNSEKTIEEIENSKQNTRYSPIRRHARNQMKNVPKVCKNCGYDKHVDCCHIIPVCSFPKNTKLSIVNNKNNLIFLCKNCHWEFDHGLLKIAPVGN